MNESPNLIVIVGPTASGKSDLAQAVAANLDGCVLSADSMQVYRGMNIGTGKVLPDQMQVDHYGLDIADPGDSFSVALFQVYGRSLIEEKLSRDIPIVVCGGTGFYIRALIDEFEFPAGDQENNAVRDSYTALLEKIGPHELWKELEKVDPASAEVIHENDTKRVVRAFELLADGTSYRQLKDSFSGITQKYPATFIGLNVAPEILNARIDSRVDAMISAGLVHEVQSLLDMGFRGGLTSQHAIGYKEIVSYLDGDCTLEDASSRIKVSTHQYAKRQRTWFRKDPRIHWLDADVYDLALLTQQSMNIINSIEA